MTKFYRNHLGVFCKGYDYNCECERCHKQFLSEMKSLLEFNFKNGSFIKPLGTKRDPKKSECTDNIIFYDDQMTDSHRESIKNSVLYHDMSGEQATSVLKIAAILYDYGVDAIDILSSELGSKTDMIFDSADRKCKYKHRL